MSKRRSRSPPALNVAQISFFFFFLLGLFIYFCPGTFIMMKSTPASPDQVESSHRPQQILQVLNTLPFEKDLAEIHY